MSTAAEYKKRENLEYFIAHHREFVQAALILRKTCPTCDAEGCHYKCSRCYSVTYCSKNCQVSNWPKHKKICQLFRRIAKLYMEVNDALQEDIHGWKGRQYISDIISDALCTHLRMQGFKAELTCSMLESPSWEDESGLFVQSVALQGRIYDILSWVIPNMSKEEIKIRPLPSYEELLFLYPSAVKIVKGLHNHQQSLPNAIPIDIDENDWFLIARHASWTRMSYQLTHDYTDHALHEYLGAPLPNELPYNGFTNELYGNDFQVWASGKTRMEFCEEMADIVHGKNPMLAPALWAETCRKKWFNLQLNADTRSKVTIAQVNQIFENVSLQIEQLKQESDQMNEKSGKMK